MKLPSGDIISPMTAKKAMVDGILEAVRARLVTVIVWTVIIVAIYATVQVNRINQATTLAKLSSGDSAVRQAEVIKWAEKGQLADVLASTQDPNSDDKSPVNVESQKIREACTKDFIALIGAGKVSDDVAMDNLYALHKDSDLAIKSATIDGLSKLGRKNPDDITKITNKLADGDPDIRSSASDALGQIGGEMVIAKVIDAVNGKPAGAKDDALATLPKIGMPAAPSIETLLDTSDLGFKGKLLSILGSIADPRSIPTLEAQALAQPVDPQIRRLALLNLAADVTVTLPTKAALQKAAKDALKPGAAIAPPPTGAEMKLATDSAPVLIQALGNPADDSRARAACAIALGRIKSPAAVAALVKSLGDIDTHIFEAARTGLAFAGPVAVPALALAVKSPVEQIRAGAAYALGGIGTANALCALAPALSDDSIEVRQAACEALGHSASYAAIPLLIARLSDSNGFVAGAASTSLVIIGKPSVPALVGALGANSPTAPIYASRALRSIGSDASAQVIAAAQSGSEKQRTWCAVVLGWLHDEAAKPLLEKLAASSDPTISFAAQQALQQYSAV